MNGHDRLVNAIHHLDEVVNLLPENVCRQFLFFKLLSVRTELESPLDQLTRKQIQPKIKE